MSGRTPRIAVGGPPGDGLTEIAQRYLTEYLDKIELATAKLGEDQIWEREGAGTNSVANLILHLCGNLSLWILASLGGESFQRDRAAEFSADRTHSKAELLAQLQRVVSRSRNVVSGLDPAALEERFEIQGYSTDGRGVVFHAVEHMSYHTGQIVLMAKVMLAERGGLEFYPHHGAE